MQNKRPSEWRVSSNPVAGEMLYGVYRIRDLDETDHSGNREIIAYYHSRDKAVWEARKLNEEEKRK